MPAKFQSDEERDAFLSEPRLAILMTNRADTRQSASRLV